MNNQQFLSSLIRAISAENDILAIIELQRQNTISIEQVAAKVAKENKYTEDQDLYNTLVRHHYPETFRDLDNLDIVDYDEDTMVAEKGSRWDVMEQILEATGNV